MEDKTMNSKNVDRRTVLAAIGSASVMTLTDGVKAVDTGEETHLIEAGIEFTVPGNSYMSTQINGNPTYYVDEEKGAIVLYPTRSSGRNRLIDLDKVIAGQTIKAPSATIGPQDEKNLITDISGFRRPVRSIILDKPIKEPAPTIGIQGKTAMVSVGEQQASLAPGNSTKIALGSKNVTTFKRTTSEVPAEVDGVPDYRAGTTIELEPTQVQARPMLQVKNWGSLPVVEINNP